MTISGTRSELTYDGNFPTALFNQFDPVEAADKKRRTLRFESEFIPFFTHSLQSANLSDRLGLMLVHKHWSVEPGELPIRRDTNFDEQKEIVVCPERSSNRGCDPVAWVFDRRSDGTAILAPTEFSARPRGLDADFFDRLLAIGSQAIPFLASRGVDDLFGFALRNDQDLAADEVWLEESYVERASIIKQAKTIDAQGAISTFWQFDSHTAQCKPEWSCTPAGEAHHRVLGHVLR